MLMLTSFLDGVKDTFEKKRNANNLKLQAMPIIHYHGYIMKKAVRSERGKELDY